MTPQRLWMGKRHKIEEYYWNGRPVVYVNDLLRGMRFDTAVKRAKQAEETNDIIPDMEDLT